MYTTALLLIAFVPLLTSAQAFVCPPKNGQYPDPIQCDKYYICQDGVASARLCEDGLVFDQFKRSSHKCDHMHNVDCEDRTELQPPQGNAECPRKNGIFEHSDPSQCHKFVDCIDGQPKHNVCPPGLHFNDATGVCTWEAAVGRTGCVREEFLEDGFTCPKLTPAESIQEPHPRYPHPTDCQKFYVCLNGVTPREQNCDLGEVFNTNSKQCDLPENVAECIDWYKDHPSFAPDAVTPKSNTRSNSGRE
uniref:Chitin-binding type-2 domain-containing protein n=1 Tax=Daphnia galeata TaxID=27404 RepID=A0A8J2S7A8_9CRUS|nr:unnamed protein product [Daphnia galeata]